ncbi:MAG: glycogen debranching enzyme family protein, partial [Planctomycetes bacterium]|nr:glycogen debranching enzyme family protein [Planctomycetota bacterium]
MGSSLRRLSWPQEADTEPSPLLTREWLVTNGLGGYASGSVAGICTRRFHGLLIAALPAPKGRTMMFNHLTEQVRLPDGSLVQLGGEELAGGVLELYNVRSLIEFRLESGLPVWRFQVGDVTLEKRIVLPHMQNTVHVLYRMLAGRGHVRLRLRPSIHFRPHEGRVDEPLRKPYTVTSVGDRHEVQGQGEIPPLKLAGRGTQAAFILDGGRFRQILYRVEQARGYDYLGFLWSPGYVRADLVEGRDVTLSASTESWDTLEALSPQEALEAELARRRRLIEMAPEPARRDPAAELVLAADQFIITPHTRLADMAWARATGDEVRTIIAGYHGFTDWSRDTMIALEGLTLATGRHADAGYIVRT